MPTHSFNYQSIRTALNAAIESNDHSIAHKMIDVGKSFHFFDKINFSGLLLKAIQYANADLFFALYDSNPKKMWSYQQQLIIHSIRFDRDDIIKGLFERGLKCDDAYNPDYASALDKKPFNGAVFDALVGTSNPHCHFLHKLARIIIERRNYSIEIIIHVLRRINKITFFDGFDGPHISLSNISSRIVHKACLYNSVDTIETYQEKFGKFSDNEVSFMLPTAVKYESLLIDYFIARGFYNEQSLQNALKTAINYNAKKTYFDVIRKIATLTESHACFAEIKESHLKKEFGSPKKALENLTEDNVLWLKVLLKRYFFASKRSPVLYLQNCPEWHKTAVIELLMDI